MREILFRGKRKDNGEWVEGFYQPVYNQPDKTFIGWYEREDQLIPTIRAVIPESVGQYTGLPDKNGKKIFEGDIVLEHYFRKKGIVAFCEGSFDSGIYKYNGWVLKSFDETVDHCELVIYEDEDNDFEVLGNITDNPELLEEDAKNE